MANLYGVAAVGDDAGNGAASFAAGGGVSFFGHPAPAKGGSPSPSPSATLGAPSPALRDAAAFDQAILNHLYSAFLSGSYSDLLLRFHGAAAGAEMVAEFQVHRMIVCRSPLVQQLLQQGGMGGFYDLTVPITDPNITQEGLTVCLGSLYSSHSRDAFANSLFSEDPATQSKYLRSVLGSALLLKLPEMAQLAVDLIKGDINRGSLMDYITFISHPDFSELYQPYAKDIRDSVYTYLCKIAVREIASQGLEGSANIWGNKNSDAYKELVRLFAELPFEWLKTVVESKMFEVPTDKERHEFARQIIALRSQTHSPNRPQILAGEENVLLAFGGRDGNKSGVTIVRKARPQPSQHQQQGVYGGGRPNGGMANGNGMMMNGSGHHEGRRIWKIGD
ncbi:hypothetical protein DFJ74DRAFT_359696 [Hyaloraphidium curvatum]|nr:hypothetical protein DFJ74DRAFT_359696 [Hyaloraphidium curvatum]